MLDENEPNAGANGPDGETTEQSQVTRRRGAAKRPAGPPPEIPEEKPSAPVTVPAAQAAPSVTEGRPLPSVAAQRAAGEPGEVVAAPAPVSPAEEAAAAAVEEAKPKRTTRTRSTATTTRRRKKTADEAETGASGVPETPDAAVGAPDAQVPANGAEAARGDAVAASGTETPGVAEVSGAAVSGAGAPGEAAEPEAPAKRRRSRKKAESEIEAGEPAATGADRAGTATAGADRAGAATAGADRTGAAAAGAARTGADRAGAARTGEVRDDAARAGGAGVESAESRVEPGVAAQVAAGAGEAAAERDGSADEQEEILEILPEDEPLDDEPAGEDLDEDDIKVNLLADPFGLAARRRDEAGGSAFRRPAAIFAPLFQAPDPTQAQPVRPVEPEPEPEVEAHDESAEVTAEDDTDIDTDGDADTSDDQEETGGRRRRRRRGGRGRGKSRERDENDEGDDSDDSDEEGQEEASEESQDEAGSSSRRRRRRRRRGADDDTADTTPDDPPNTVVRIRAPRSGRAAAHDTSADGVQSVRGSTRLEAKKQRRREGRELGRRRPPIITESEFLARRESVDRMMVVRRQGDRTQIAVLEDGILVEHYVNREASQSYVGNVYLGKVQNVLPSMEAAFVDVGKGRNAVLYAGEVNFDTAGLEGQPKRIESALKSGQSVLVQVTKDPIGHKGARLTSQISLPGRYLVYVPDGSMTGISRKLPDKERTRLKSILKKVMPENAGVIVRTAAEGASEEELARDVARLSAQWENIRKKAKSASPPELLSAEPDLTIRVVRDVFNEDFSSLVVQGEDAWETVDEYVKYVAPHLAERLTKWDGGQGDVFESYRIDEQLAKAMERKVWLPSGGSLVIDRTEAMTVVDVNTGKFTGQGGNLEETVTRNNLEAAEEIVRQLRLRDIGGIIVIDFIDMVLESNRDLVLRRMLECLARDRTKHQVAEVTSLGLVQMTRKRVGQGLLEAFSTPCDCCNGRGLIVSTEPVESKPEPRGTQGKMAVEKAVSDKMGDKVSAAKDTGNRDTVTGALDDVPHEDDHGGQSSGRGRRRSRRAKSAE
ncbi:Rne/Rng family ribonuclease [Nonomuraea ferruginea]|uniref:Rne/Rng family ribonuclease n=1 Tax=Nonomuraea ferruginea TaxID=46174 RepID=A0ABT4T778_9ACTN|nr:Rne/Rng family ribonuclease [Nonomuraea ferruginea]MDA0645369.1 Rne/Rng family ribonuclease [Nonomuraea ferruginea]